MFASISPASSQVSVEINSNKADAREAEARGEAALVETTGRAEAAGFEAQKQALGGSATALVAVANAVSEGGIKVVPDVLVSGGVARPKAWRPRSSSS